MMKIEKTPVPLIVPNPDDPRLTERVTGIDQAGANRWLYLAAATLGLAVLTKYNGIFVGFGFDHDGIDSWSRLGAKAKGGL